MQIINLPQPLAILLCFVLWPLFQLLAALICRKMPARFFAPCRSVFRTRKWEKDGKAYKKIFHVQKWKKFLPDIGSIIKADYAKKKLTNFSRGNLERFLVESCRAEMTHWLAILPFWIFGLFTPAIVILYMLMYALAINIPCIIAQRYNRPRIINLLAKM